MSVSKRIIHERVLSIGLIAVAAVAITVTGILSGQHVLRMIPLYVSLVVGLLQSRASRYANLIGGINAMLYAVVYFFFGLYASAASALLVSAPFQLATFIRWGKRAYKHSTRFRRLGMKLRIGVAAGFALCFAAVYLILSAVGSSYRLLDITISLISVFTSVLALLSYVEYSWLMLGTGVCSILLDMTMMRDYPGQITYLVFSIYSMICILRQFISVRKLYSEQMKMEEK